MSRLDGINGRDRYLKLRTGPGVALHSGARGRSGSVWPPLPARHWKAAGVGRGGTAGQPVAMTPRGGVFGAPQSWARQRPCLSHPTPTPGAGAGARCRNGRRARLQDFADFEIGVVRWCSGAGGGWGVPPGPWVPSGVRWGLGVVSACVWMLEPSPGRGPAKPTDFLLRAASGGKARNSLGELRRSPQGFFDTRPVGALPAGLSGQQLGVTQAAWCSTQVSPTALHFHRP